MAINLHEFTGEERVDTELAPLLNENFNALKDYADDASRWQILPVQFSGDNVKYLLQETSLSAANTTYVLPLIKIDDTNVASACDLRFIILKENGSIKGISADIKLQKISSTNCAVNYSFTPSEDITLEPCTFTYESVKYAGLKITVGADLPECIWANGFITEVWQDAIAYKSGETVSNNEINNSIQVLGSDMVLVANMFKHLQTDKSPVSDYDVVNKKSLNDLTNVKTYSALSQIGLSGDVLDFHPYTIGNALPANSMLIIGIGGDTNNYNYPVTMGNLTVVRANTNHVLFQIDQNDSNGYNTRYVLEYNIDTASVNSPTNWKQILTDIDTGYWQPNETVTKGTVRKLLGAKYAGCFLVCKVAGTTGSTYPSPNPEDGAGLGGGGSSNLTIYTSLEQIGIVPGTETFESIHEALPLGSELTFFVSPNITLNHSLYPADAGIFEAIKLDNSLTNFRFNEYHAMSTSDDSNYDTIGILWSTWLYEVDVGVRTPIWNYHLSSQRQTSQTLHSTLTQALINTETSGDGIADFAGYSKDGSLRVGGFQVAKMSVNDELRSRNVLYVCDNEGTYHSTLYSDWSPSMAKVLTTLQGLVRVTDHMQFIGKDNGQFGYIEVSSGADVTAIPQGSYFFYGTAPTGDSDDILAGTDFQGISMRQSGQAMQIVCVGTSIYWRSDDSSDAGTNPSYSAWYKLAANSDAGWTISKGTNGWARESSTGLTLQWGVVSRNNGNNLYNVTFPKAFTNLYGIHRTNYSANVDSTSFRAEGIQEETNSSFKMRLVTVDKAYWYAIGIS